MLTKSDLSQIKTVVQGVVQPKIKALGIEIKSLKENTATKDDLKGMATKDDLKNLEVKLLEKIDDSQMEIIATVDKHKEDKDTVDILRKQVERLEENAGLPPYPGQ